MAKKQARIDNPVQVIATAFVQVVDAFRMKRNPHNGKQLISNVPTQLMGNMTRSFVAVWARGDGQMKVDLTSFQPARNLETGEERKDLAGRTYKAFRYGQMPAKIAQREFWYVLSYFAACLCKGQLPTPSKRSGSSTIMSHFVRYWIDTQELVLESIKIVEADGAELTYTAEQFDRILGIFSDNGDDILRNWDDSIGGGGDGEQIDWV